MNEVLVRTRNEVAHNLIAVERPDELKDELLDTLYDIDRSLGENALFAVQREWYQAPSVEVTDSVERKTVNEVPLF